MSEQSVLAAEQLSDFLPCGAVQLGIAAAYEVFSALRRRNLNVVASGVPQQIISRFILPFLECQGVTVTPFDKDLGADKGDFLQLRLQGHTGDISGIPQAFQGGDAACAEDNGSRFLRRCRAVGGRLRKAYGRGRKGCGRRRTACGKELSIGAPLLLSLLNHRCSGGNDSLTAKLHQGSFIYRTDALAVLAVIVCFHGGKKELFVLGTSDETPNEGDDPTNSRCSEQNVDSHNRPAERVLETEGEDGGEQVHADADKDRTEQQKGLSEGEGVRDSGETNRGREKQSPENGLTPPIVN